MRDQICALSPRTESLIQIGLERWNIARILRRAESLLAMRYSKWTGNGLGPAKFLLALASFLSASAAAQTIDDWARLEHQDQRLAAIAERMQGANADLCNAQMPLTGMVLHSADQYREGVALDRFANGVVSISTLLAGSPADAAGLQRDDGITAIGGQAVAELEAHGEGNIREAAFDLLAEQPPEGPVVLQTRREAVVRDVVLNTRRGCRSLVEILVGDGPRARSDGRVIQIRFDFAAGLSDDHLAIVFAHELAHAVLEHRRRKEEAGIDNGMLAELGRNQRANRTAEIEADRLSVHLLSNAGYDPATAADFWRNASNYGMGGNLLPSFVYPSREARAELIEREIAMYLPTRRGPSWPGHLLALRESSFVRD